MGCLQSLTGTTHTQTAQCIQHLKKIDMLLQEMLSKYTRQLSEVEDNLRTGIRRGQTKQSLITKLRKKKIILHYMNTCQQRIDSIVQKQYALEQLDITAMQVEAMKGTAKVLKHFNKTHNVDKIEELQENMSDLQDQIMEISDVIGAEPLMFDESELEEELMELCKPEPSPMSTIEFPVVPNQAEEETRRLLPSI
jgi:predicted transcriptional regulator